MTDAHDVLDGWLTSTDDLPLHQAAAPFARPTGSIWNWTERWYFALQNTAGQLVAIVGGGIYPNTGVFESYLCVVDGEHQLNHTENGPIGTDRLDNGFLKFQAEVPMRRWVVRGNAPDCGLHVDLRFDHTDAPFPFQPFWVGPTAGLGDGFDQYEHVVQPGRIIGTISVHGRTVAEGEFRALRDRTWGVRSRRPKLHNWTVLHLDDGRTLTFVRQENAHGHLMYGSGGLSKGDGGYERMDVVSHRILFDAHTRVPDRGEFVLRDTGGNEYTLSLTTTSPSIRIRGAGYDDDQGRARGDFSCRKWDLSDPKVAADTGRGTIDSSAQCVLRERGNETPGAGVWETAVGRRHPRYGSQLG